MITRSGERGRRARRRSVMLALAALLVTAFAAVHAGSAAALGEQCSGQNVRGLGAFLQTRAQIRWGSENELGFNGSPNPLACSGSQGSGGKPKASYVPVGSPAALRAWGAEDGALHTKEFEFPIHFLGTDVAPSGPVGVEGTMLNRMRSALGSDVVVVPVTQTAIAIVANPPALPAHPACTVSRISATQLQKAFSGEIKNWRQLSAASDPALGGDCDQAITRVVRGESAGTTYQFKHYLDAVNPSPLPCTGKSQRTWAQLQAPFGGEAPANVEWPRTAGCQEGEGPLTAVSTGNGEGESGPLQFVAESHGTITYASLPEAQDKATKLIVDVNNGAKFVSPATESGAANCSLTQYTLPKGFEEGVNVDWSQVYGSDPKIGETAKNAYPICTLSWDVAAADSAGLFGGKVATTVHDYLRFVTAPEGGQASVRNVGYQDLPPQVQEAAIAAIAQIGGEEKEEEGGGGEEEGGEEELTPTVLCRVAPEAKSGVLVCPSGKAFADKVLGVLMPETKAEFKASAGTITCEKAFLSGTFAQDGTSPSEGGVFNVEFYSGKGPCTSTISKPKAVPEAVVRFDNGIYDASRFVYLGLLAPQGALVIARSDEEAPRLRLENNELGWKCFYQPTFLSGQVANGSPTELILNGSWSYSGGGGEECPPTITQVSDLALSRAADGGPIYVSGE